MSPVGWWRRSSSSWRRRRWRSPSSTGSADPLGPLRARQPPVPEATLDRRAGGPLPRPRPPRALLALAHRHRGHQRRHRPAPGGVGAVGGRHRHRERAAPPLRRDVPPRGGGAWCSRWRWRSPPGVSAERGRGRRRTAPSRASPTSPWPCPSSGWAALVKQLGVWVNDLIGHRLFWTLGATSPDHASLGRARPHRRHRGPPRPPDGDARCWPATR